MDNEQSHLKCSYSLLNSNIEFNGRCLNDISRNNPRIAQIGQSSADNAATKSRMLFFGAKIINNFQQCFLAADPLT
uniref:Uncharacterized protein n=1 Tax=Romanomermis culicivorax TaxID=13658 RepID=A0A915I800_ROMCU